MRPESGYRELRLLPNLGRNPKRPPEAKGREILGPRDTKQPAQSQRQAPVPEWTEDSQAILIPEQL